MWQWLESYIGPVTLVLQLYNTYTPGQDEGGASSGHYITIRNPLQTLSVLEPKEEGGCANPDRYPYGADNRALVRDSAEHYQCLAAVNAGFFDTSNGQCLGNLISNGRLIQRGPNNVNFGIRKSGAVSVGYLNQSALTDTADPFVQLMATHPHIHTLYCNQNGPTSGFEICVLLSIRPRQVPYHEPTPAITDIGS